MTLNVLSLIVTKFRLQIELTQNPKKVGQARIFSIFNNFLQIFVLSTEGHEVFAKAGYLYPKRDAGHFPKKRDSPKYEQMDSLHSSQSDISFSNHPK